MAIIAYKLPTFAVLISIGMIFANALITFYYVDTYDLKAGFMATQNFFLL